MDVSLNAARAAELYKLLKVCDRIAAEIGWDGPTTAVQRAEALAQRYREALEKILALCEHGLLIEQIAREALGDKS